MKKDKKQQSILKFKTNKVNKFDTKNPFFSKPIYFSYLLNIFCVIVVLLLQRKLPPVVPLYYGLPEGEAQLVNSIWLVVPALLCLMLTLVNSALSIISESSFLRKMLFSTSLLISIFSAITTFKIIFLVGSF